VGKKAERGPSQAEISGLVSRFDQDGRPFKLDRLPEVVQALKSILDAVGPGKRVQWKLVRDTITLHFPEAPTDHRGYERFARKRLGWRG
jgi:hypothetical protein